MVASFMSGSWGEPGLSGAGGRQDPERGGGPGAGEYRGELSLPGIVGVISSTVRPSLVPEKIIPGKIPGTRLLYAVISNQKGIRNSRRSVFFKMAGTKFAGSPLTRLIFFMVCLAIACSIIAGAHYFIVDLPMQKAVEAPANGEDCTLINSDYCRYDGQVTCGLVIGQQNYFRCMREMGCCES